jgi:hypothetical protein
MYWGKGMGLKRRENKFFNHRLIRLVPTYHRRSLLFRALHTMKCIRITSGTVGRAANDPIPSLGRCSLARRRATRAHRCGLGSRSHIQRVTKGPRAFKETRCIHLVDDVHLASYIPHKLFDMYGPPVAPVYVAIES